MELRRSNGVKYGIGATLLLGTLACRFAPLPTPTLEPLQLAVEATSTALASSAATAAVEGSQSCPTPPGNPPPPDLSHLGSAASEVERYLNAGGSPATLQALLDAQAGRLLTGRFAAKADVDGNGFKDLILSLIDPVSEVDPPTGTLFAYVCRGTGYRLTYTTPSFPNLSAPIIHAAKDLNGDLKAEVLIGRKTCGANTCFEAIEVLVWAEASLQNRLQGSSSDLPNPVIEVRPLPDQGIHIIRVTGTGVSSAGAGPYRPITRSWTWNSEEAAFTPEGDVIQPSNYRIHRLWDADRAAAEGDYRAALSLYDEVIHANDLRDWADAEAERANLSAYARFRRVLALLQLGDLDGAQAAYDSLVQNVSPEAPGSAFAELAEAFWTEYQAEADLSGACSAAQSFAITHSAEILDALYFGYANPSYGAADICPIPGE